MSAQPPPFAIEAALAEARKSPCAKSRRGAAVYGKPHRGADMSMVGVGHNAPALGSCRGTEECRRECAKLCVHAEANAIRGAAALVAERGVFGGETLHLVHVKLGADGKLAAGGGPSCWQCSKEILHAGIAGVWLFQEHPHAAAYEGEAPAPAWRYYGAVEFHRETLKACGLEVDDGER